MTAFEAAVDLYREPKTRAVGLRPRPNDDSTDNGLLFSSRYILLKKLRGETLTDADVEWFKGLVAAYSIERGMVERYPGRNAFESHDDLSGVAAAAFALGLRGIAADFLYYGETHNWNWNTEAPGVVVNRGYLDRFPAFVPHLRACAGQSLTFVDQLAVFVAYMSAILSDGGDTSGRLLMVDKADAFRGRYPFIEISIALFERHLVKKFGGLRGLSAIYYGFDHPFTQYAPELKS